MRRRGPRTSRPSTARRRRCRLRYTGCTFSTTATRAGTSSTATWRGRWRRATCPRAAPRLTGAASTRCLLYTSDAADDM
eukprot:800767-Prymnesium_polylepis.1